MPDWQRALALIKLLRKDRQAPVDEFGPRSISDPNAPPHVFQYQILTALMLSSQTKDQKTAEAMLALRRHGLTVENIAQTPVDRLVELIRPVGFYNLKAGYMKSCAEHLLSVHSGRVPNDLAALLAVKGLGPKMANLVLQEAFNLVCGIAVDTHVHRLANKLGWVKTTTPLQTQTKLEALLPVQEWDQVNLELVGLGQMIQQKAYHATLRHSLLGIANEEDRREATRLLQSLGFEIRDVESPQKKRRTKLR